MAWHIFEWFMFFIIGFALIFYCRLKIMADIVDNLLRASGINFLLILYSLILAPLSIDILYLFEEYEALTDSTKNILISINVLTCSSVLLWFAGRLYKRMAKFRSYRLTRVTIYILIAIEAVIFLGYFEK